LQSTNAHNGENNDPLMGSMEKKSPMSDIPLVDLVAQYMSIKPEIDSAISSALESGHFIGGEALRVFADRFAAYCNVPHCVPCANGTDAIEIALSALGIGKGDEVIIPAFSFVATLEAVCNVGATPVLCDIDPRRFTIDPYKAIALVTPYTKAFIPVHLYGQVADIDPLISFASDNNMFVIEDAAQAHGAIYKGQKAGSIGDINTFSFYPGKNLGAYGDAGAITTRSEWLYTKCLKMANHGRITKYDHDIVGRNSRMDSLQAAVLSVKLDHIEAWTQKRQEIARRYLTKLSKLDNVQLPHEYADSPGVYHLFVIRVEQSIRDDFRKYLQDKGIETGIHYPVSLSKLKVTTEVLHIHVDCPESEKASREVVSLPIYPELTTEMQDYICEQVFGYFKN
jgi:dTDP-4-amino-4,6-dideoxygalactose transaminase